MIVLLAAGVAVLLGTSKSAVDIRLEIAKGLVNLIAAIAVTGILAFVLSQRSQAQARHDEKINLLTAALQDLKTAYERVGMARFFMSAHPSPKTFQEQIHAIAQARTVLQRMQRDRYVLGTRLDDLAQAMLTYLSNMAWEYRDNYPCIAVAALQEEQMMERARRGEAVDLSEMYLVLDDRFPMLAAFVSDDKWKSSRFQQSYSEAKQLLQDLILAERHEIAR